MGLFDREIRDSLDEMFDYNRDGRIDHYEEAMEFAYLDELDRQNGISDTFAENPDHEDDADGEYDHDEGDFMGMDDYRDELEDTGLDCDELEFMDEYERREALEDVGLDPDDYDF